MYAIAIIRYRKPLEQVTAITAQHRDYLAGLEARGLLIASGPLEPRYGGALLLRLPEGAEPIATLDAIRDGDPYWQHRVAQYELLPWLPGIGKEALDAIGRAAGSAAGE